MLIIYYFLGLAWTAFQSALWSARSRANLIIKTAFALLATWYSFQIIFWFWPELNLHNRFLYWLESTGHNINWALGQAVLYSLFALIWTDEGRYNQFCKIVWISLSIVSVLSLFIR